MMKKRKLGQTDLWLSPVGLGTVKFGRNQGVKYPHAFDLPDDKTIKNILACAHDLGINLLDTAPAYGISEARLGKLIPYPREDWLIMSKAGERFIDGQSSYDFTPKQINMSLHDSLKRLNTDYLDIFLIHSNGEDEHIINTYEVFTTLESLKKAGKIRSFGMSTKTVAGGLLTLQHADCAMVTHNLCYQDEAPVLEYAKARNKGILIKKAFASGHFTGATTENKAQQATRFVLSAPAVTSLITGTINEKHLRETVSYAEALSDTE